MSASDVQERLEEAYRLAHPVTEMPRFRYFQSKNGPMFSWTTERFEDRYASFVHVPVGSGSRSGKADHWNLVDESLCAHTLRKDAKARALRLFRAWEAGDARPWA